jgi:pimeloyl-ACP methyl ester carboxylesterase
MARDCCSRVLYRHWVGNLRFESSPTRAPARLATRNWKVMCAKRYPRVVNMSCWVNPSRDPSRFPSRRPRPAGLVGVILCASFVSNPRPRFAPCRHVIGLLPITATPLAVLNAALLGRFTTPLLRSELAKAMAQVSSDALRARLQAVLSVDVSAHLKTIDVPVLYLLAKYDRVVPLDALEHLIRLHPATQVEPIEAPHFLLQAAPTAAATAVRGFLASLPKPSARIPDPRPSHRLRDDDLPAKLPKQGV